MEYWFKALQCKIWSTNTKPIFWERKKKLEALQKLSHYIRASSKLTLKFLKRLNEIFWALKCFVPGS